MDTKDFMPGEEVIARIKSDIAGYEAERGQIWHAVLWRVPVFVGGTLLAIAAIALTFNTLADPYEQWFSAPHLFLYFGGAFAVYLAYRLAVRPARRLKQSFRERVIPSALVFIDHLWYRQGEKPQTFERFPPEITGRFSMQHFGDMISGLHDGFGFEIYEATLSRSHKKSSTQLFKGVIVAFGAASPFPGLLVAKPRGGSMFGIVRKLLGSRKGELLSGTDEVDARYSFLTDNVAMARPLVTGRLAQALQWLIEAWPNEPARVALNRESCFLLIPQTKPLFRLPSISRQLDYNQHIAPLIAELGALLATASLIRKISIPEDVQPEAIADKEP